ncbi:uncharacterized protein [Clytia hemisphaerica]|uniref:uncharacterized protein n=1 Tax=Clytia hemisphaerica TaxID=252671 RepID=UPI0034D3D42A
MKRVEKLPEKGVIEISNLQVEPVDENEQCDSDCDSEDNVPDLGPIDHNSERAFNENTEMNIGTSPLSEFNTPYLASLAFPTLFPDTKGDPTNPAIIRRIAQSETEDFAEKLKHLIKFAELNENGKWYYRFASHPRFAFWGFNMLYRKRLINQGNFFIKQNPGDANLSIDELQDMINNNNYSFVMKKLQRYSKNVTGTNAYWYDVKEKLKATITQMGTPTIFWTLSMADFHWPDIHDLFTSEESESTDFRQNIIDNPHIVDWLFTERVKSFVKHWLYVSLDTEWHWYRFEFAVMRGSIHCHGLAKLKNDPGICNLTEKALKGFLAENTLKNESEIDVGQYTALRYDVIEGKAAETQICDYVDSLMTAVNPIEGPVDEWRNDPRMNRHQQLQLQAWRANCDIQIILDHNACNVFRKLIIKSVGERDFSAQEVMHQILSLKLHCSTFDVVNCSLEGSRQMKVVDQELIKYKPWKDSIDDLWEGLPDSSETYCLKWKEFLNSTTGRDLVPNWKIHFINANNFEYELEDDDDDEEESESNLLREDWMDIADLNSSRRPNTVSPDDEQYWAEIINSFTTDQINAMPFWIDEQKKIFKSSQIDYSLYDVNRLNKEQLRAYNIVKDHVQGINLDPLLMILTGIAGSGKSYLINCIKRLLGEKCSLTAFFGIAAFNINGKTLHTTLQLPIRGKNKHELKGKALEILQEGMLGVEYLIIDEFSVVGQRMLGWIDSRCRQATGKMERLFGGISVILVGDIAQLPPVLDSTLYSSYPQNEIGVAGYVAYCCFRTVIKLKSNMRSAGQDEIQKKFREALKNLRNGVSTMEDWNLFLTRQPDRNAINYKHYTRLSFANETVREHNTKMLDSLEAPIATIKSKNTPKSASKISSEDFGLENEIFLAKGAKVMLTRNLWSDVGLCNGSLGTIKDIVFPRNQFPPVLPIAVIVKFDKYTGPSFFDDVENCVPIVPLVASTTENGVYQERIQIPLKLAWSITIHKSQGLTLDKVVVDLGKKESFDGLTYVALSRVKKLNDMVIESFPFERINKLSDGKRFKFRVREESRLEELAARNKP